MPKYLDMHHMKPFTAQQLREAQKAPEDEFGVTHHDVLFSEEENKIWCVLDAPNKEAVEQHHEKAGIKCEWIREIESARE